MVMTKMIMADEAMLLRTRQLTFTVVTRLMQYADKYVRWSRRGGLFALSNSALGKWSAVSHGRFIPPPVNSPQYLLYWKLAGLMAGIFAVK
jgi:hypothetical protein